jgi:opacity protein-like surface antigen
MANAKYTAHLNDMFSVYGAVGVGHIWLTNFDGPPVSQTFELSGFGYQLIAGVGGQLTDGVSVVGEYRYQDTFSPYDIGGPGDPNMTVPTSSLLAGVKFGF